MSRILFSSLVLLFVIMPPLMSQLRDATVIAPPMEFIRNAGQWDEKVEFGLLGGDGALMATRDGVTIFSRSRALLTDAAVPGESPYAPSDAPEYSVRRISFVNASPGMRVYAADTSDAVSHFYHGAERSGWYEHVSNHRRVVYEDIWEGIDAVLENRSDGARMILTRNAHFRSGSMYRIRTENMDEGQITDMLASLSECEARTGVVSVTRRGVDVREIALNGDSLATPAVLSFQYASFLGGTGHDMATGFVLDKNGEMCITGLTQSSDFPVHNAMQAVYRGNFDRFLLKLSCDGSSLRFSTYFGGSGSEAICGSFLERNYQLDWVFRNELAIAGDRFVTFCSSDSPDFPVTPGALQSIKATDTSGAVLSFAPNGTLRASTFLGGPGCFAPSAIITDRDRNVIITGLVYDDSLSIIPPDALQGQMYNKGKYTWLGAVVIKLNSDLSSLRFATYMFAPEGNNIIRRRYPYASGSGLIMIVPLTDDAGNVYITGHYPKEYIPLVHNRLPVPRGNVPVYITKLTSAGDSILYSSMLGDKDRVLYADSRIDRQGNVHVTGFEADYDYPLLNPIGNRPPWGTTDVYSILSSEGELLFSTYLYSDGYPKLLLDMCGNSIVFTFKGESNVDEKIPLLNAFEFEDFPPCQRNYVLAISGRSGKPIMSSWFRDAGYGAFLTRALDPRGFHYRLDQARKSPDSCHILRTISPFQAVNRGETDLHLSRFRIDGLCNPLTCSIILPDSIRVASRRGFAEPDSFLVTVEVENSFDHQPYRVRYIELELPDGIDLDSTDQTLLAQPTPDILVHGAKVGHSWRVHVRRGYAPRQGVVKARIHYAEPEAAGDCPPGIGTCEAELPIRLYEDKEPLLRCTLEGPDSLTLSGMTLSPNPFELRYRLSNIGSDTAVVAMLKLSVGTGMGVRSITPASRPGRALLPGGAQEQVWQLEAEARPYPRTVRIRVQADDQWGFDVSVCEWELYIPAVPAPLCSVAGDSAAMYDIRRDVMLPDSLVLLLSLENACDTLLASVQLRCDLSAAPHVRLRAGQEAELEALSIPARSSHASRWVFELAQAPSLDTEQHIRWEYRDALDTTWRECGVRIPLRILDQSLVCDIATVPALTETQLENREKTQIDYTLSNVGTVPVTVARVDLAISPGAGVLSLDPLSQPGGTLAPSSNISRQWRLRPLALRQERTARFDITAYGAADSVFSVCTHDTHIPGIDGLRCDIHAPDTVRFVRDPLCYDPDPVPVNMNLRNILDTPETSIEAEIDLTAAPRFELATGETAIKTLASLDSNSAAQLLWLLHPLADTLTETQDITIRYRSIEQGEWKECSTNIIIEAWPQVQTTHCIVSGHDSLHADQAYERLIPEPFEISYTATNTGTVVLRNCSATIMLLPEFELVSDSATLSFGELRPGDSNTRWWTLKTTPALADFGAYPVNFTWYSDEQGSVTGCDHTVHILPDAPTGIVFTPLHLHFEAVKDAALPAAQYIQLWTGGGLSMPWTAQGGQWWLNADPVSGDHAARIAVQPNSTALPIGLHATALTIAGQAPNLPKDVAVTYEITGLLDVGRRAAARLYSLGPVWPQPVPLNGEASIAVNVPPGEYVRIALHDALGREVAVVKEGVLSESDAVLRIAPTVLRLRAGMYFVRMIGAGAQATRAVVVR
jgi:hypothetical protein